MDEQNETAGDVLEKECVSDVVVLAKGGNGYDKIV